MPISAWKNGFIAGGFMSGVAVYVACLAIKQRTPAAAQKKSVPADKPVVVTSDQPQRLTAEQQEYYRLHG